MTEIQIFETDDEIDNGEIPDPAVDDPTDLRPDLSELGIIEHERGICEDTYENRQILRRAKLNWQPVYDASGKATGLIIARSQESMAERRILSLAEKRPLLVDPDNRNSDYLTGLDLLLEDKAIAICPPWVVGATRGWQAEQNEGGPPSPNRAPKGLPGRCRIIKSDGIRCMLWHSGRVKDDGLCRVHLKTQRKPGEDIERARRKIIQAAPYAVDVLEDLMENAESEPVRLKASTEILDRAGIRGGQDLNIDIEVTESRPAAQIVAERLARLAEGAINLQNRMAALEESAETSEQDVVDAEIVEGPTEDISDIQGHTSEQLDGPLVESHQPDEPEQFEFEDLDEESRS